MGKVRNTRLGFLKDYLLASHCRLLGFLACLAGAAVCFAIAFITLPLLAIRPAKFALSFRYVNGGDFRSFYGSCVLVIYIALVAC